MKSDQDWLAKIWDDAAALYEFADDHYQVGVLGSVADRAWKRANELEPAAGRSKTPEPEGES